MPKLSKQPLAKSAGGFVQVRGACEHNLKHLDVDIPRDSLVVFTGISGSGKSSLAFGTLYAEAQRRYLESVSPYARRLFHQMAAPEVRAIEGLPPAVALQQQRGAPTTRSSVGSVTTLSNLLRMLYSRAGQYPPGQEIIYAEGFSPNTPQGACPACHGLGRIYDVTEQTAVPDDSLTIRQRAIAAWPPAWGGQNQRDILVTLGFNIDKPWRDLPKKDRDWILFTDEQPVVPVYAGFTPAETRAALKRKTEPSYMGTFTGVRRYVLHTFATTHSPLMKKRALRYMLASDCPECHGKRLRAESLSVKFAGIDIAELSQLPLKRIARLLAPFAAETSPDLRRLQASHPEQAIVTVRIAKDLLARITAILNLGLGYLALDRSTPTLSPGELQRLRLATQLYSNLFGVVYVLDEPSAGLHPADTKALLAALDSLKDAGNSLFVVEHEIDVMRHADWIVDVGPDAGQHGGEILYSGPPDGLRRVRNSKTAQYLFGPRQAGRSAPREPNAWLQAREISRNNLRKIDVDIPLGVFTTVTGVSGSGKSTLVSQVLVELMAKFLGDQLHAEDEELDPLERAQAIATEGRIAAGGELIQRLVRVDQKPIGRSPRSNMATYTGIFDPIRRLFAATKLARKRRYNAGRFSFNVGSGRCEHCQGEGFVMVELLFLPSVYAPCPTCKGSRYKAQTLEVTYRDRNVAEVLAMTVDEATSFFADQPTIERALRVLADVGLGYLRLGQPATEFSGGEAQRVKLATELQRAQRGRSLYILDEPTTGLHPADVEKLLAQLNGLVDAGNSVVVVEHDMQVIAQSDWIIDMGPGAGDEGGQIVVAGTPAEIVRCKPSRTGPYLREYL